MARIKGVAAVYLCTSSVLVVVVVVVVVVVGTT